MPYLPPSGTSALAPRTGTRAVGQDEIVVNVQDHGIVPNDTTKAAANRAAINTLIATLPKGSVIRFTAQGTPDSRNFFTYYIDAPIDYIREVEIRGDHKRRVVIAAGTADGVGFTGNHMIRNWVDSDYTVGETDHTVAPLHTATPMSYVLIENLRFDVQGQSNLTCVGVVHIQETSVLRSLVFDYVGHINNPTVRLNNVGIALYTNGDSPSNCSGRYEISDLVQYGDGWKSFIRADNTAVPGNTGSINVLDLRGITSAPNSPSSPFVGGANYSDSPIYLRGVDAFSLLDFEIEGLPPDTATDAAQLRAIDVSGLRIAGGRFSVGGNTSARPAIRATTTGTRDSTAFPIMSPLINGVRFIKIASPAGNWTGSIIEDETGGISRHFARDATLFDPCYIHLYDGTQMVWAKVGSPSTLKRRVLVDTVRDGHRPTGVIRETYDRLLGASGTATPTSGTLLLVPIELEVGDVVNSLTFTAASQALATGTHQWSALFDPSRNQLAISADDTSNAWTAQADKTFTMTAAYTVTKAGTYYAGLLVTATTVPTLIANPANNTILGRTPFLLGSSSTGLTDPASCPATAAAITAQVAGIPYVQVK